MSGSLPTGKEKGSPIAKRRLQLSGPGPGQGFAWARKRGAGKSWQSPAGADSAARHPALPDSPPRLSQIVGKRLRATFHRFRLPVARVLFQDLH